MIVFVTGGSGFVGQHFIPILLSRLAPDDTLYLLQRDRSPWADPRIRVLEGDFEHVDRCAAELRESRWIFHIGGNASFDQGGAYDSVNAEPVRVMAGLLKESTALERFVLVSTIGVLDRQPSDRVDRPLRPDSEPNPTSAYGRSKLRAEDYMRQSGLPFTIIRPGWVYGDGMRRRSHISVFVDLVARGAPLARLRFPGRAPLIHVRDLCEAMANCIGTPASAGKTYIGVTENRSLADIFSIVERHFSARGGIAVPRFRPMIAWAHRWLPLSINGLFLDYLAAEDPDFGDDLLRSEPVRFEDGVGDVLARHPAVSGYWLVTGANSGIGQAVTRLLLSRNARVIAVDRQTGNLTPSDRLEVIEADLTDPAAVDRVVELARRRPLAYLVNNAGVGHRGDFLSQTRAQVEAAVRVNVLGTLSLTHGLRRQIIRDGTTIVNVASSVAYHPLPHMSVYAATKAFILNWSLALAEELRPGNRVVTFSPSGTRTNFQRAAGVGGADDAGLLSPDRVAVAIVRAADRGRLHVLMGAKSRIFVSASRLLPLRWRLGLHGRLFRALR